MTLEKVVEDPRGKLFVFRLGKMQVNLIEIRKGFSRGGHFHKTDTSHHVLVGKIEYRQEDSSGNGPETVCIFTAPCEIRVPANTAHMLTALEDSILVEVFSEEYEATNYPKYRSIIEASMIS
jgi:dTDP-4-dehydrorhamnose 3,5-epimerase-like enzyme